MTRQTQSIRETETNALSEAELDQVSAGLLPAVHDRTIIAVQPQAVMGDGSVKPAAEKALIGLL
ncbi:hypothetical protein [Dongia sp.]|uniref:hypothetical protein n=1 Tax=Dongia sp. TaxID=1977262 RepID=UPI003752169C